MNTKKILISIGVVIVVAFIAIFASHSNQSVVTTPAPTISSGETATSSDNNTATGTPSASAQYKDGSYTGPTSDAIYGKIQVVAIISGGALTDVQVPIYPTDGGHTLQVSQSALPVLEQEAIQSQSANVNVVSGATQTSEAFQQSLAAALAMAK